MPFKEAQISLISFFSNPVMSHVAKTRLFGGPYLHLYDFCKVASLLYMTGAILGYARRNYLNILVKMLVIPGTDINKQIKYWQNTVKERLEKFSNETGREPDTFDELILYKGLEDALKVEGIELSPTEACEAYSQGDKKVVNVFHKKVTLEKAQLSIQTLQIEGIGFGSFFPELTERMYQRAFRNDIDEMDTWTRTWAHGLNISKELAPMSLEKGEKEILKMVASYASKYYPELLDPLDLRGYIDTEGSR